MAIDELESGLGEGAVPLLAFQHNHGGSMRAPSCARGVVALILASASQSTAGTDRYYFDPVGHLLGSMESDGIERVSSTDPADNPSYLHILPGTPPVAVNQMNANNVLVADSPLTSSDSRFTMEVQDSGALTVYEGSTLLWSSNSSGLPGYLIMGYDGDLVLHGPDDSVLWSSNTAGDTGAYLVMQSTGDLEIIQGSTVVWSSGTGGH